MLTERESTVSLFKRKENCSNKSKEMHVQSNFLCSEEKHTHTTETLINNPALTANFLHTRPTNLNHKLITLLYVMQTNNVEQYYLKSLHLAVTYYSNLVFNFAYVIYS